MSVVMLTGASGFLGIQIVARLLNEGHRVRALVRTPAKLRENLALLDVDSDDPRIEVVPGDMTDAAAVREAVRGCDRAIHAAATFSFRRRDAERMKRENKAGTTMILEAATAAERPPALPGVALCAHYDAADRPTEPSPATPNSRRRTG